ncbi:GNAT family N-acetyltransferase [Larkinella soli]|uniref:GNAT family N-acetyltransferase n=1 Tax=Larkinella soli TaxID=1770527 RepID=UPI000FFC4536|nr:GNAT family N-acetyltransferase [Larkinella soli]
MEVTIRTAHPADYSQIVRLINEFALFQGVPHNVTITAEQMQQDQHLFYCLVAETEAKDLIGFATYFPAYYSWTGKALYLDDLYVKEEYRKQGVGRQLLKAVINLAKEQSCKKVRWQVSNWNTNAIAFYQNLGARVDTVEINCDYKLSEDIPTSS